MEQRKAHRVAFERGFSANMMAIDGTWQRPCTMQDVSETGARSSPEGVFPCAFDSGESIPALPTSLGQRRSAWRQVHQSSRHKEEVAADRALSAGTEAVGLGIVDGPHHRLQMAGFEQKDRSSERQTAPCEILRLVQPRGVGQALPMIFHVHAYVDDHVLKSTAKTEGFCKSDRMACRRAANRHLDQRSLEAIRSPSLHR